MRLHWTGHGTQHSPRNCCAEFFSTASEQKFLLTVKHLAGQKWPANYACTALNIDTCEFTPLTVALGGDLQHGVAAGGT